MKHDWLPPKPVRSNPYTTVQFDINLKTARQLHFQAHKDLQEQEDIDSDNSDNTHTLEHTPDISCIGCHPLIKEISEDLYKYLNTLQGQIESISHYTQVSFNEFQQAIDPININYSVARLYRSIRFAESPGFTAFRQHILDYFRKAQAQDSDTSSVHLDPTTTEEEYHQQLSVILEKEDQDTEDNPSFFEEEDNHSLQDQEEENFDLVWNFFDPPSPILTNQQTLAQAAEAAAAAAAATATRNYTMSTGITLPQFDLTQDPDEWINAV